MKKSLTILVLLFAGITACHKKTVPTFTTRSIDINETANTKKTTPDIESGKTTFVARCNRCHDLPDPGKYNEQRWGGILSVMTQRARLTKEEKTNVTAYIKANCSK